MQCPDSTHVDRFIRGGLSDDEVLQFEAHLDTCDDWT
jgi:anti-sigma factor RsiW